MYLQINTVKYNATENLRIFTRIYKQFDRSFSLICYYLFIFGLLRISVGLSVFGFIANKYQWRAIRLLSTICNIQSAIWWAILKVILNYLRLPTHNHHSINFNFYYLIVLFVSDPHTQSLLPSIFMILRSLLASFNIIIRLSK